MSRGSEIRGEGGDLSGVVSMSTTIMKGLKPKKVEPHYKEPHTMLPQLTAPIPPESRNKNSLIQQTELRLQSTKTDGAMLKTAIYAVSHQCPTPRRDEHPSANVRNFPKPQKPWTRRISKSRTPKPQIPKP